MSGTVVIIGPGYPLRGGLATFDQRLAREFINEGYDCTIYSFSLQYPGFMFPGTTQYSTDPPPEGLTILSRINSINPINWWSVGNELKRKKPDIIVVRYWLPLMGPALGTILRRVKKNRHTRILAITDNIIPHEKRPGDQSFTRYFLNSCDAFITMSEKVMNQLRQFQPTRPARQVVHPLYDNFGEPIPREEARALLRKKGVAIGDHDKVLLFFGFIRNYKGLDIALQAMADQRVRDLGIKLLVAGEFYEDSAPYHELIARLNIGPSLLLRTDFIPDSEVRQYLCAADAVIQPYRNATQSGVTPLAYHFEKPMIVSSVGGLAAMVPHEQAGLVAEPEPTAMAEAILRFFVLGYSYFIPALRREKTKYSWSKLLANIIELCKPSDKPQPDLTRIDRHWTLFLDRDGVINQEKENSYVFHYGEFQFYDQVKEALRIFAAIFGRIVIVTNQRGVGKGLMTAEELEIIHEKMLEEIALAGGRIDRIYYSDSLDDNHPHRKPNPGMAFAARTDFPEIDFSRSLMVGNNLSDMEFGRNAGMYTVFLRTTHPDHTLPDPAIDLAFNSLHDFAKHLQNR
ncbi:MAG TPA: HAD-IIIA family hydrolase [Puia sp.]|jgi:histidinol-phosphate phosphatase family protein|nr:HAD-IIIA family hydrolase [Puia sp.]